MEYKIRNVTPNEMICIGSFCPSVYEGLREVTTKKMNCLIGGCPSMHEAQREGDSVYLIVGRVVNPSEAGLEGKVGEGETLIEVPKRLIDEMKR